MAIYLLSPTSGAGEVDGIVSEFIVEKLKAISVPNALADPLTAAPWIIAGAACVTLAVVVAENAANLCRCRIAYSEWRQHSRQSRWHVELVEGMRSEAREALEGLADLAGLSRLPGLPCLPTFPDFSTLPELPALQSLRHLPMLRRLSHLSDLPALPALPRLAGLSNIANFVRFPDILTMLENARNNSDGDADNEVLINDWINDDDFAPLYDGWTADIERAAIVQLNWLAEAATMA
jgi:hypothetical protein